MIIGKPQGDRPIDWATLYHAHGLNIIPVERGSKKPLVRWMRYQSTRASLKRIREWWTRWPHANIAVVCGKSSGIFALDADSRDGILEVESVLVEQSTTLTIRSKKGLRWLFKLRGKIEVPTIQRALHDVDLIGEGGLLILPPSIHPSGLTYSFVNPTAPIADPSPQLIRVLREFIEKQSLSDGSRHLPGRVVLPQGYLASPSGIFKSCGPKKSPDFIIPEIVAVTASARDNAGDIYLRLSMGPRQTTHQFWVPRREAMDGNALLSAAGMGFPVHSSNKHKVVKFLADLEAANRHRILMFRIATRPGWARSAHATSFVLGNQVIGDPVHLVYAGRRFSSMAIHLRRAGDFEEWKWAIAVIRRQSPVADFVIAASFACFLLEILHVRSFLVVLVGESHGGKTALVKAVLSIIGNPDGLIAPSLFTQVGLEWLFSSLNDLIVVLDELSLQTNPLLRDTLAYLLAGGRGKVRGRKDGGIQEINAWSIVGFVTGEEPLSHQGSFRGQRARILDLPGRPIPDVRVSREAHQVFSESYGHAGPIFLEEVVRRLKTDPEFEGWLRREHVSIVASLTQVTSGLIPSRVQSAAAAVLAGALADSIIFGLDFGAAKAWLSECAIHVLKLGHDSLDREYAERGMEWLVGWAVTNSDRFNTATGQWWGKWDVEGDSIKSVVVVPYILEEHAAKAGFSARRLLHEWRQKGWLIVEEGHLTVKRSIPNCPAPRVHVILLSEEYRGRLGSALADEPSAKPNGKSHPEHAQEAGRTGNAGSQHATS